MQSHNAKQSLLEQTLLNWSEQRKMPPLRPCHKVESTRDWPHDSVSAKFGNRYDRRCLTGNPS